jgi:hypothetical protein
MAEREALLSVSSMPIKANACRGLPVVSNGFRQNDKMLLNDRWKVISVQYWIHDN